MADHEHNLNVNTDIKDDDELLEHIQSLRMNVAKDRLTDPDPKQLRIGLDALKQVSDTIIAKKRLVVEDKQVDAQGLILSALDKLQTQFGNVNPFARMQESEDPVEPPNRPDAYADITHVPEHVMTVGDQGLNSRNFIQEYESLNPIEDDD